MQWLANVPTTQLRIAVTLVLAIGTAVHYWWTRVVPDRGWLAFLAAMAGIDAAQMLGKRATNYKYVAAKAHADEAAAAKNETVIRRASLPVPAVPDEPDTSDAAGKWVPADTILDAPGPVRDPDDGDA